MQKMRLSAKVHTLDVYGHVTERMKQADADQMEQFIKSVSG